MKRILLAVLAAVMILNGCASTGVSSQNGGNIGNKVGIDALNIVTDGFFFVNSRESQERKDACQQAKDAWLKEAQERYNVALNVISRQNNTEYADYRSSVEDGTFQGICSLSYPEIQFYSRNGAILPLDDYLKDNAAWNSLSEETRKMFEIDGHVWAIPMTNQVAIQSTRSINTEWLAEIDMDVPQTLAEFEDYAIQTARTQGGKERIAIHAYASTAWAADIMREFGLYFDENSGSSIAYDPVQKVFADAMLHPNAEEALAYLRRLYQNGAIAKNWSTTQAYQIETKLRYGIYGTAYENQGKYGFGLTAALQKHIGENGGRVDETVTNEELVSLFADIPGFENAGEYPLPVYRFSTGYVVMKNAPKPSESINFWVDFLFASDENYLNACVGSSENYRITADRKIEFLSNENRFLPALVQEMSEFPTEVVVGVNQSEEGAQKEKYYADLLAAMQQQNRAVVLEQRYCASMNLSFLPARSLVDIMFEYFARAVCDTDMPIADILEEYRSVMRDNGADATLQKLNDDIGQQTTQRY